VIDHLRKRDWPGNVRELEHVIKRALLVARGPVLTIHDLASDADDGLALPDAHGIEPLLRRLEAQAAPLIDAASEAGELPVHELAMHRLEQALIRAALAATAGNQVAASRLLGISRSTLRSKLEGHEDLSKSRPAV